MKKNWLKNGQNFRLYIMVFVTVLSVGLSILVFQSEYAKNPAACFLYSIIILNMISLAVMALRIYRDIRKKPEKCLCVRKLFNQNNDVHVLASSYFSLAINIVCISIKLWMGIVYRTYFLIVLAVCYIALALIQVFVLRCSRKIQYNDNPLRAAYSVYAITGGLLFLLNLSLFAAGWMIVAYGSHISYPGCLLYVMIAYAVVRNVLAVRDLLKTKNEDSPVIKSIYAINYVCALISILSLQSAILFRYCPPESVFPQWMNASTGTYISVIIMTMSTRIIMIAVREKNNLQG